MSGSAPAAPGDPVVMPSSRRTWKSDAACAVIIALAAAWATWIAFRMLAPAIVHTSTFDYWFESDAPAISIQLSDRFALENERANRHPLFAPALYPVPYALRHLAGFGKVAAVGLTYAGLAALWSAVFFLLLRLIGLRRVDAITFTALALAASSVIFWFPVPETFAPAALTLLLALAALAWHEKTGRLSWIACVLISALTLSMTITNAVAGFLVCLVVLGWKRGLTAIGSSLALVAAGQFVARLMFPHLAYFFLPGGEIETSAYLLNPLAGSLGDRLAGFFLHGLIIPPLQQGYAAYLSVQQAGLSSVPVPVLAGWCLWLVLLVAGIFGLRKSGRPKLAAVLVCVLASQLALVLVFGQETFLYLLQSGPLLVALAAFGCLTPFRRWVLSGAAILTLLAAVENGGRFAEAAGLLRHRYDGARAYAQALSARTGPDELIVLGLQPAAALGWVARRVRRPVTLDRIPRFDSLRVVRKGWPLYYEHWSPEALEQLHRAGARYFASEYAYGIRSDTAVRSYLETHGSLLEGTPDWVIYALRQLADTAQ
jgi:hypothetical protein